ncbi:MAG: Tad domain-containing protein [Pseudomonadota bacterium]
MGKTTFFRTVAADPTANVIAISAAALIPLIGMVGGAVDASRYYMTTTRLQAACDAGALAARRAMDKPGDFNAGGEGSTSPKQVGLNFFDQNFEDGLFNIGDRTREYTADDEGVVTGTASGTLPTSLMYIFGYDEFNVSVSCSADINIANTDVMFVLDVTGSMNCPAAKGVDDGCSNNGNTEYTSGGENASRIQALREAVVDFYDVVEETTSASAQVRYGFVPYSQTVNVGLSIKPWLADEAAYQSREWFEGTRPAEVGDWILDERTTEFLPRKTSELNGGSWLSSYQWQNNRNDPLIAHNSSRSKCHNLAGNSYNVGNELWQITSSEYRLNQWAGTGATTRWRAACVGDITKLRKANDGDVAAGATTDVSEWIYHEQTFDVSAFQEGTAYGDPVFTQTGSNGATVSHIWDGCIHEAETNNGSVFDPVPSDAYDLDIDLVPTARDERWKPALPGATYRRFDDDGNWTRDTVRTESNWSTASYVCPVAAQRLSDTWTESTLTTYVNSLRARGNTYHDFGMIWGGRFVSPTGIFSSANATAPNGDAIARHIIFMTDGTQATNQTVNGLYGIEWWDRNITNDGSRSQMRDNHAARFQAVCRAARNKNISVWVVAFGTDLSDNLEDCATPGRAFEASNATELRDTFKDIAEKISALRLTS